jgi:ABC-type transport system involved in multi-copper enzyme maturation permease subunit
MQHVSFMTPRLEIQIRSRHGQQQRVVLGKFTSLFVTIVLTVLAIAVLALAIVFGYVLVGIALAALLIGLVIAIMRGAWSSLWRR